MLGLGVMINMLSDNGESVKVFLSKVGKVIKSLEIKDNALLFSFVSDDEQMIIYDDGQSCCEYRYMHTDDDLEYYIGSRLMSMEVSNGPEEFDEWGEVRESQFLKITTSKGVFTVVNYNEHNGYYGGFFVRCEVV